MVSQAEKDAKARYYASDKGKAARLRAQKAWRASRPLKFMLIRSKARAKAKGFEFNLSEADFTDLPTHCPVLGLELKYGSKAEIMDPCSASFDRIDSSKGYVPGNVEIISLRANKLKQDATLEELEALVAWLKLKKE